MYDKNKYKLLKENPVECLYCKKVVNAWSINRHFKTQFCLSRRELLSQTMPEDEFKKLEYDFLLFVDSIKNDFKNN